MISAVRPFSSSGRLVFLAATTQITGPKQEEARDGEHPNSSLVKPRDRYRLNRPRWADSSGIFAVPATAGEAGDAVHRQAASWTIAPPTRFMAREGRGVRHVAFVEYEDFLPLEREADLTDHHYPILASARVPVTRVVLHHRRQA